MTCHMALCLTKLEISLVLLKLVFVHSTNYLWYIFDNTVTFNCNRAIIYFLIWQSLRNQTKTQEAIN